MEARVLVGTVEGLWEVDPTGGRRAEGLAGRTITALTCAGAQVWAIVDGRTVVASRDERDWDHLGSIEGPPATCLAPTPGGLLVGTEEAHLFRLMNGRLTPLGAFETVEGRQTWYTPWGDPADIRSIATAPPPDQAIYVNVHVGGVVRSRDGGRTWTPTLDIEADVHQVLAHPARPDVVLVAAAAGFGVSRHGGDAWEFVTAGMHAHYLRAVAVADEAVLVSASTGHRGKRAAIYRKPLDGPAGFARCRQGLPAWFDSNIDTACLVAAGSAVAFGTEDGRVFRSLDGGERWDLVAKGLPEVRCVAFR